MDYTARQIRLFHREAVRAESRERADRIEAAALGFGGGKDLPKLLRALRGEP